MGSTMLAGWVVTYLHESLIGGSFPDDIDDVDSVHGTRRWLILSRRPTPPKKDCEPVGLPNATSFALDAIGADDLLFVGDSIGAWLGWEQPPPPFPCLDSLC